MNCLSFLRKKHGLTQKELAHASGVSRDHLSRIEGGKVFPTLKTEKKIVSALGQLIGHTLTLNDVF